MTGSASALFHASFSEPPRRGSTSHTFSVNPGGGSIQRFILSGVVIASQTRRRGALKLRVRTMVVSVGVVIWRPVVMVLSFWNGTALRPAFRRGVNRVL